MNDKVKGAIDNVRKAIEQETRCLCPSEYDVFLEELFQVFASLEDEWLTDKTINQRTDATEPEEKR